VYLILITLILTNVVVLVSLREWRFVTAMLYLNSLFLVVTLAALLKG